MRDELDRLTARLAELGYASLEEYVDPLRASG